jgi:hypothetical protein
MEKNDFPSLSKIADATTKIIPLIRTPLAIASFALILLLVSLMIIIFSPTGTNIWLSSITLILCLVTFSAVTLLALRLYSKDKVKSSLQVYKPGEFDIPAQLVYFSQGKVNKDGKYLINVKQMTTVRSLGGGNLKFNYFLYSRGVIKTAMSLSDPDRMQIHGSGSKRGAGTLEILDSKIDAHYLVVTESTREVQIGSQRELPYPSSILLRALFDNVIKTNLHAFVGTRIITNTAHVRIVLQFDEGYKPNRLHPIEISPEGRIIEPDVVIADIPERSLYVAELTSPKSGGGFYIWWKWDKFPKNVIEGPAFLE